VGVAVAGTEALHLDGIPPVDPVGGEPRLERAQSGVVNHLVAPGRVRIPAVPEDAGIRGVAGDDICVAVAVEGMETETGFIPGDSVAGGRVEQIPPHAVNGGGSVHFRDGPGIGENTFVPELEDLLPLVPEQIRIEIVEGVLPGFVGLENRILLLLPHRPQHETDPLNRFGDAAV